MLPILETEQDAVRLVKSDPVISSIGSLLASELDTSLTYHSVEHSDEVLSLAVALAATDGLNARDLLLIGIAAAYHDSGFLEQRLGHEIVSADLAESAMRTNQNFSKEEINLVKQMIWDTKLQPIGPSHCLNTALSPWLIDADLSNLGRPDFLKQTKLLADELDLSIDNMLDQSVELMNRHQWFSPAGQRILGPQKDVNVKELRAMLQRR
tara:strand:- start:443 stop:1072 length:630 start_codon:yes stop_codon:yes gene_type:complete